MNRVWVPLRAVARRVAIVGVVSALACSTAQAGWFAEAGVESFDWREHTTPITVRENGPRFSFALGYLQPRERGPLFALRGELYGGNVDYDGSFQFDVTTAATGASTYLGTTFGGQARWRWPEAADAVAGIEYESWSRRLSRTQEEKYRTVSLRIGVERVASGASPIVAGIGMRFLLATGEDATIEDAGVTYQLGLEPGRGSNPYVHAGTRILPHVTLLGFWDGMSLGRSNQITLLKRGRPVAYVRQPESDLSRVGVRVVYGW